MDLSIETCDDNDHGTQRCRIGPKQMEKTGIAVASCMRVKTQNHSYICSAWPRYDGVENSVKFDKLTYTPNTESLVGGQCTIESVMIKKIIRISVTIVFMSIAEVRQYKQCLTRDSHPVSMGSLKRNVLNILRNLYVADSMSVNCESLRMAKLYNIGHLKVNQVCTNDGRITCGMVSSGTKIQVTNVMSIEQFGMTSSAKDIVCGGCELQVQLLTDFLQLPSFHAKAGQCKLYIDYPHGILIQGPSGSGKSTLVLKVSSHLDLIVLRTDGSEVFGAHVGEGEEKLRMLFAKAVELSEETPCVVLIEEVDALCPRRGAGIGSSQERRMVAQLATCMDKLKNRQQVMVVGTTSHPQMVDATLRRPGRFEKEILLGVPTMAQRKQIVELLLTAKHCGTHIDAAHVAEATPGFVAADLKALVNQAHYLAASTSNQIADGIMMDHFERALHDIVPSTQRDSDVLVDHRPVSWDDVGGLGSVKVQLQQAVEWPMKHGAAFSRLGIAPPNGVLLYGPPGCAKTLLVRAAASACGATFLAVSGAQLHSPFIGDAEKKLTEVFRQARAGAPSIIFLDEVDAIMGKRKEGSKCGNAHERVLSMLLNELDGVGVRIQDKVRSKALQAECYQLHQEGVVGREQLPVDNSSVLVVAATNRPDMIDDALMRPGRLDKVIYVPPPDLKARLEIIRIHTRNTPLDKVDLKSVAEDTDRFSGADLESLCREAALHALSVNGLDAPAVTQAHFIAVLCSVKPSLSAAQLLQYQQYLPNTARQAFDFSAAAVSPQQFNFSA